jgi:hypothetical protein
MRYNPVVWKMPGGRSCWRPDVGEPNMVVAKVARKVRGGRQRRSRVVSEITSDAQRLLAEGGLEEALNALLKMARTVVPHAEARVSEARCDDDSDLELIKVEFVADKRGREAIDAEDVIFDLVYPKLGEQSANRFMIVVR